MWLTSKEGVGSTFLVALPVKVPSQAAKRLKRAATALASAVATARQMQMATEDPALKFAVSRVQQGSRPGVWSEVPSNRHGSRLFRDATTSRMISRSWTKTSVGAVALDLVLGTGVSGVMAAANQSRATQDANSPVLAPTTGLNGSASPTAGRLILGRGSREASGAIKFPFDAVAAGLGAGLTIDEARWLLPGSSPGDRFLAAAGIA